MKTLCAIPKSCKYLTKLSLRFERKKKNGETVYAWSQKPDRLGTARNSNMHWGGKISALLRTPQRNLASASAVSGNLSVCWSKSRVFRPTLGHDIARVSCSFNSTRSLSDGASALVKGPVRSPVTLLLSSMHAGLCTVILYPPVVFSSVVFLRNEVRNSTRA